MGSSGPRVGSGVNASQSASPIGIRVLSVLVYVLGETFAPGFGEIDVADGIDPEPVARARRVEAGQHLAAPLHDADRRPLLADVGHLLLVEMDVGRLIAVAPLPPQLPLPAAS